MPRLADIPFLGGYIQSGELRRQAEAHDTQQIGAQMGLLQRMQAQQELQRKSAAEQQFRSELQSLGENATPEQRIGVAAKYAPAKDLLTSQTAHLDRKAADETRRAQMLQSAMQFEQNLDIRQGELDRKLEEGRQRITDAQARQRFEEWYKTESLKTQQSRDRMNHELRKMGLDMRQMGSGGRVDTFMVDGQPRNVLNAGGRILDAVTREDLTGVAMPFAPSVKLEAQAGKQEMRERFAGELSTSLDDLENLIKQGPRRAVGPLAPVGRMAEGAAAAFAGESAVGNIANKAEQTRQRILGLLKQVTNLGIGERSNRDAERLLASLGASTWSDPATAVSAIQDARALVAAARGSAGPRPAEGADDVVSRARAILKGR